MFGDEQCRIVGVELRCGKYAGGGVAVAARDIAENGVARKVWGGWRRSAVASVAEGRCRETASVFFAPDQDQRECMARRMRRGESREGTVATIDVLEMGGLG